MNLNLGTNLKIRLTKFSGLPSLSFTVLLRCMFVLLHVAAAVYFISDNVQNSSVNYSFLKKGRCAKQKFNINVFIRQFEFIWEGTNLFLYINLFQWTN